MFVKFSFHIMNFIWIVIKVYLFIKCFKFVFFTCDYLFTRIYKFWCKKSTFHFDMLFSTLNTLIRKWDVFFEKCKVSHIYWQWNWSGWMLINIGSLKLRTPNTHLENIWNFIINQKLFSHFHFQVFVFFYRLKSLTSILNHRNSLVPNKTKISCN